MQQPAPSISIKNLNFTFKDKTLFSNFSVEFPSGQFTSLIGLSGVGKTTLLRLIAGLYPNRESFAAPGHFSYLTQHDSLFPWLTVEENILLSTRLKRRITSQDKDRVKEYLQRVELRLDPNIPIAHLSGGMKQKCALARVLFEDRPIVLLDEPFSSLDSVSRWRLQTLLKKILKNKTVVMVTHCPLEAMVLSDKILLVSGNPIKLHPINPQTHTNLSGDQMQSIEHLQSYFITHYQAVGEPCENA